jgi:UDP-N-acetylmuramoyl-L-alanyl-D-glutamate--2,6-diaminopimelate ligase
MINSNQYRCSLGELIATVSTIRLPEDVHNQSISQLTSDSRTITSGGLFLAYPGQQLDGRGFIQQAIAQGAKAILLESPHSQCYRHQGVNYIELPQLADQVSAIADRFYCHPSRQLKVMGITGTNGKTSCCHFIAQVLHQLKQPCATLGTLGYGLYPQLRATTNTTPGAVESQRILAELVKAGAQNLAMEVSSHALDQGRVNSIQFHAALFTNLTRDHLDYHGSFEQYGKTKSRLLQRSELAYTVINRDDPFTRHLKQQPDTRQPCYSYSLNSPEADIYAQDISLTHQGMGAYVTSPWGQGWIQPALIGEFNLSNILGVIGLLGPQGIAWQTLVDAINQLQPVPGRLQLIHQPNQPLVVIDYAHTPDALIQVLKPLKQHCAGKLFIVFGCGGDRDRGKRPLMGQAAEQLADQLIITDDNPRHESPQQIIQDILSGLIKPDNCLIVTDRQQAIKQAVTLASPEDLVLIAGKGHETYQEIQGQRTPFDDRQVALAALTN